MGGHDKARTSAAYTRVADSYATLLPDTRAEQDADLDMVDDFVDQLSGGHVLDAGCGTGRMASYMIRRNPGLEVVGVDISTGMLEQFRKALPGAEIFEADIATLPFANESFHGVLAWYSIIHSPVEELGEIFHEFRRVLKSGGLLLIAFQAGAGVRHLTSGYGRDVELKAYLHSTERVITESQSRGFAIQTVLERGASPSERHPQAILLSKRL